MAWPPPSPKRSQISLLSALRYSDQFDYPLTLSELWFWQIGTRFSPQTIIKRLGSRAYYHLPSHPDIVSTRLRRNRFSHAKWSIAQRVGDSLARLPTIRAVFVTGALAMNNSPRYDDIDIMIITSPHTLWLTRLAVVILLTLTRLRRPTSLPEHSSPRVSNKICDNLYLDTHNLLLPTYNLYIAHEILQAQPLFDRSAIRRQLLFQNSWVKDYLPIAYRESLRQTSPLPTPTLSLSWLLAPFNLLAFFFQYLYMRPKMTSERIGLGFAFFHPGQPPPKTV